MRAEYQVNPARVGAWGSSAGGHLAELLGVLDGAGDAGDPDPVSRLSSKVGAVVTMFAPTDLPAMFSKTVRPER